MTEPDIKTAAAIKNPGRDSLLFAILAFVPFLTSPFLAVAAIITGHRALKKPQDRSNKKSALYGCILGYVNLALCVFAVWAAYQASDAYQPRVQCSRQMEEIGRAVQIWADKHGGVLPHSLLDITNDLASPKILTCPADFFHAGNVTNWDPESFTYQYVLPGKHRDEVTNKLIIVCPIHNAGIYGDGYIGWPPISKIKE